MSHLSAVQVCHFHTRCGESIAYPLEKEQSAATGEQAPPWVGKGE